ncbi:protein FAR-RED IMPAIRED RESPONSE 1-like [Carya illinoinensis]|uniref:protein FAR-RED IMPAIRED RESPONSE 1-like n=1 Tax=Carya illinoinensis TaxID=32201 RepID=UPI001C71B217|nr:protein FAR-RED IMPAIRED RESPONSE 1-like [Carya illinoinensis]
MHWVPVYLKNTFWAGMSTTQRSESMNAFFDGYVHSGTTLKEFIDQFNNVLRKKVENELAVDFHSFNCTVPCISLLPLKKKFQAVYTNSKFKEVQAEIMGIIYSHCVIIKTEGAIITYQVNDQREVEDGIKKSTLQAYFNKDECETKCMCGLFEMRGIICRHILSILAARDVQVLPEKYIMERWRKDIKRRYALIRNSYDDLSGKPAATWYSETGSSNKVLSHRVVRGKGRPPSKRKQPTIEKLQTKNKKASGKRQRLNATSHTQDVLNPVDSVAPSQLPATQQSVISQVNSEMHGPLDD